jgi:hypothetical protein
LAIDTMLTSTTAWKQKQNTPPTHSNQFQLFHGSKRQQYGMYIIHYSIEHCIFRRLYIINNNCNFNLIYRYSLTVKTLMYYSVMVARCCSYSCSVLLKMGDDTQNM